MNLFGVLEVSGSALGAQRLRAEIVAANLANMGTTRTAEGGPYRRQLLVLRAERTRPFPLMLASLGATAAAGVRIERLVSDTREPVRLYQPGHPDADKQGYVAYPAVNPVEEMADLLSAARSYELNASVVQAAKAMIQQSIELLR
jgi:flagellar basal-body rod protein FlgC